MELFDTRGCAGTTASPGPEFAPAARLAAGWWLVAAPAAVVRVYGLAGPFQVALRFPRGPVAIVHPLHVILHPTSNSLSPTYDLAHLVHIPSIKVLLLQPIRVRVRVRKER